MSSFIDAVELRNHLAGFLQPYLGEWENGTPRIHIVPPRPRLSPRDKVAATTKSEVECIIRRASDGAVRSVSGPQKSKLAVYRITLTNFADDTKLTQAIDAIERDSRLVLDRPLAYIEGDGKTVLEEAVFFVRVAQIINQVVYTPA